SSAPPHGAASGGALRNLCGVCACAGSCHAACASDAACASSAASAYNAARAHNTACANRGHPGGPNSSRQATALRSGGGTGSGGGLGRRGLLHSGFPEEQPAVGCGAGGPTCFPECRQPAHEQSSVARGTVLVPRQSGLGRRTAAQRSSPGGQDQAGPSREPAGRAYAADRRGHSLIIGAACAHARGGTAATG